MLSYLKPSRLQFMKGIRIVGQMALFYTRFGYFSNFSTGFAVLAKGGKHLAVAGMMHDNKGVSIDVGY